ncbi:uncharacterized protein PHACADRAFT_265638 [Phanerochaete carnosa HHB-10118-sp]|uniref:Uncharacterized protein n=1 Tax=Phanerochaete carnosa (strain HHB-10118-sp) TaxID=650164 RepID=K5VSZ0_PHACS|nr:uncharacterized protein PHACADRAFT_265638 [Phanerochaete carnosa HHB-10118-sp]EKM49885.1 hypothetical protein PHACADRAFT_265638 [Phanerochaete carnosa HHB-10118-sp]
MAEAHDTLDSARALALLRAHDHKPFALLFAADPSKQNPSPIDLVLSYVRASYNDCLPQVRDGDPNPPESDLDLEVYAAYFSACPEPLLSVLLDRIIGGINPRALRAYRAHNFATLLDTAPYLRPRFPSTQDPANGFHGRISTINQHPASPYLFFALRLATWSAAARAGLVKRGVVQTIEALYDMPDEIVIETDYGEQVVSSISQHIMLQLCYLLLGSLSDCYDPSGSTLMEELRADIVSYSRSMLRRLFAPGRETRDD